MFGLARPVRRPVMALLGIMATAAPLALTTGQAFAITITLTASGTAPVYWTLASAVVDSSGTALGAMTSEGQTSIDGSGSGAVTFTSAAITAAGIYGVRAALAVYADAARSVPVQGSPLVKMDQGLVTVAAPSSGTSTSSTSGTSTPSSGGSTSTITYPAGTGLSIGTVSGVQATSGSILATIQMINQKLSPLAAGQVPIALQINNAGGTQVLNAVATLPALASGASSTQTLTWSGVSGQFTGQAVQLTFTLSSGAHAEWSLVMPGTASGSSTTTTSNTMCATLSAQYDSLSSQMRSISAQIVAIENQYAGTSDPLGFVNDPTVESLTAQFQVLGAQRNNVSTLMTQNSCP